MLKGIRERVFNKGKSDKEDLNFLYTFSEIIGIQKFYMNLSKIKILPDRW